MRRLAQLALPLALLLTGAAWGDQTAWEAVWRSEAAGQRVTLQGQVDTMAFLGHHEERATAQVMAAGGKLRLDYAVGTRHWSLIDDGRNLIQLRPTSRQAFLLPRPVFAQDRSLAERNYTARLAGTAQLAGRPTQIIEITPRGGATPVWRLWLDRDTSFALKRERYDREAKAVSATEYLSVQFGASVPPQEFVIPVGWSRESAPGGGPRLTPRELETAVGFAVRLPHYLPRGFALQGGYAREGRPGGPGHHERGAAAELRYTDGLRLLSLYQRVSKPETERESQSERSEEGYRRGRGDERETHGRWRGRRHGEGGLTAASGGWETAVRYQGADRAVVVVGDLTEDELRRVAQSLE